MGFPRFSVVGWLFGRGPREGPGRLWPRWLFLRALGLIFFSAFYSLLFQIRGLIGPEGILPAGDYLDEAARQLGWRAYWFAPTVYWFDSSGHAMMLVTWLGLAASVALVLNLWPRGALAVCLISYASFVTAAQDFSSYQSDGMLLAAGFISLFFAPAGFRPRLGEEHPPSRASLLLLEWLWFRIYFESGIVKLASGDPEWRHLTALDQYYANGPLPNWIGWYAQQLPHSVHAATALATLVVELGIVWMLFLPRRLRLICFFIVTPFQIGIILTANLAFINHLVLVLGFLLLDDRFLRRVFGWLATKLEIGKWKLKIGNWKFENRKSEPGGEENLDGAAQPAPSDTLKHALRLATRHLSLVTSAFILTWIFYASTVLLLQELTPVPLPMAPVEALEPFRIANQYGLFAVMTRARYEIEFQGSRDGEHWTAYPFRYKPQDPKEAPHIYAPYQPRFDWNLWFASLVPWRQAPIVAGTEERLLVNDQAVLSLFAGNPFDGQPPAMVRAVMWQYWFTDSKTKRQTGMWWNREYLGLYAPELALQSDGRFAVVEWPTKILPPPEPAFGP
jgi:Lipase maturation factor